MRVVEKMMLTKLPLEARKGEKAEKTTRKIQRIKNRVSEAPKARKRKL